MDDKTIELLVVPNLISAYEDANKSEQILKHRETSIVQLESLLQLFEIESTQFDRVLTSAQQTAKLISVLLQFYEASEWSTKDHEQMSRKILNLICNSYRVENLEELFSMQHESNALSSAKMAANSFKFFLKKVGKDNFDSNPAACSACITIILSTHGRKVESCLSMFMPFTLNHLDHYLPGNKIKGMKLLTHILKCITSSELLFTGLGDVFYETLHRLVFSNEVEVLEVLYPCMFQLLSKICRNPSFKETFCEWNKYDELVTLTLQHMRYESEQRKQLVFLQSILTALQVMTVSMSKHVKLLLQVVSEYFDGSFVVSNESALRSLHVLEELVFILGGKLDPSSCEELVKCLFQVVVELENSLQVREKCTELLNTLYRENVCVKKALEGLNVGREEDKEGSLSNVCPHLAQVVLEVVNSNREK
ncbi:TELO2-interacting protein 2-like [Convolutriloba macropyga]|uniref:TELO2-interacting protein 2-like n=1 Tax=Convolutriloba macropyga TaxID=536237 RepID=UPI003F51B528